MNYGDAVLTLFRTAAHAGSLPDACQGHATGPAGGPEVVFSVTVRAGTIAAARFGAVGCPHVIAACEWVCREAEGRPLAFLSALTVREISAALSAPVEKTGSLLVVEDALQRLTHALETAAQ